ERLFAPNGTQPDAGRIRIVERYRTRRTPAVVVGDPTSQAGPREVRAAVRWDPSLGRDALNTRWAASSLGTEFPLARPRDAAADARARPPVHGDAADGSRERRRDAAHTARARAARGGPRAAGAHGVRREVLLGAVPTR